MLIIELRLIILKVVSKQNEFWIIFPTNQWVKNARVKSNFHNSFYFLFVFIAKLLWGFQSIFWNINKIEWIHKHCKGCGIEKVTKTHRKISFRKVVCFSQWKIRNVGFEMSLKFQSSNRKEKRRKKDGTSASGMSRYKLVIVGDGACGKTRYIAENTKCTVNYTITLSTC